MPNIALFHPQIVHFVVAGAGLGLFFRWVSLTGKLAWTDRAAAALILIGTAAAWFAVRSGTLAHGVVERIPGAAPAVGEHEEAGVWCRNVLTLIAVFELMLLVPAAAKARRVLLVVSSLLGVAGAATIYRAGKLGGELVYSYAGGVGTRSGDTTDVNRAVVAALYNRAALNRSEKNRTGANAAFVDLGTRFPHDATVQLLVAESFLTDKHDGAAAKEVLDNVAAPADTSRDYQRYMIDKSDAFAALGMKDSAKAILAPLAAKFPESKRIQNKLDDLK